MIFGLDGSHALVATLVAAVSVLSRSILELVKRKRYENGHGRRWNDRDDAERLTLKDLRGDIQAALKDVRGDIHEVREIVQPLVTRVAVLETNVSHLMGERP